jgi:glutamate dehydrogenase
MRMNTDDLPSTPEELLKRIRSAAESDQQYEVFRCLLMFNQHVLKTNFYQATKVALSFRMDPAFLPTTEYKNRLFGMFFVVGSEFRGFHLRFADIARGGIRIVKSVNREVFANNCRNLFDENYNLAHTQEKKNKDIPESGAKGTILLDADAQQRGRFAFEKYVDAILDLLLVGQSPGIKDVRRTPAYCARRTRADKVHADRCWGRGGETGHSVSLIATKSPRFSSLGRTRTRPT